MSTMFAGIASLEEMNSKTSMLDETDILLEYTATAEETQALYKEANELFVSYSNIVLLIDNVAKNGLNPAVLEFVNSDNILSKAIPQIPSLESLAQENVSFSQEDVNAALEGLENVAKRILDKVSETWYKFIHKVFESEHGRVKLVEITKNKLIAVRDTVHDKEFSHSRADSIKTKLVKFSDILKRNVVANKAFDVVLELLALEVPKDKAAYEEFTKKYNEIVKDYSADLFFLHHNSAYIPTKKEKGTFSQLGYTAESFGALYTQSIKFTDEYEEKMKKALYAGGLIDDRLRQAWSERSILEITKHFLKTGATVLLPTIGLVGGYLLSKTTDVGLPSGEDDESFYNNLIEKAQEYGKRIDDRNRNAAIGAAAGAAASAALSRATLTQTDRMMRVVEILVHALYTVTWNAYVEGPVKTLPVLKELSRLYETK